MVEDGDPGCLGSVTEIAKRVIIILTHVWRDMFKDFQRILEAVVRTKSFIYSGFFLYTSTIICNT